ncbi:hypothetical protein HJ110_20575 [Vibrio parahaemolyticus]|nr:hypothetical protein [Vibrio parahaemolyticus]
MTIAHLATSLPISIMNCCSVAEFLVCAYLRKRQRSLRMFIDMLIQESNSRQELLDKLYRAEDWLIQNYYYCLLWRNQFTVTRADSLYGTETDNMGVMSLLNCG